MRIIGRAIGLSFVLLAVLLAGIAAGCGGESADSGQTTGGISGEGAATTTGGGTADAAGTQIVTIEASGGDEVEVQIEVADDYAERQRGLMERIALGQDRGMLFVFDGEEELSFWMKGTLIPLSIAYMDSEGRIVDIQDMKPLDDEPPHYVSAEPAMYALEVNQGFFDERGVEVGDRAELPD